MKRLIALGLLLASPLLAGSFTPGTSSSKKRVHRDIPRSKIDTACGDSVTCGTSRNGVRADYRDKDLLGLWSRFTETKDGDPVRFYYFHTGGIGLFRYGRVGLTYTRMFTWSLSRDGSLALEFTKSGLRAEVPVRISGGTLVFTYDPMMEAKERYQKRGASAEQFFGGSPGACDTHPFARMWTHRTRDPAGQESFRIYQFQAPGIDGRGLGWFHQGDMTEWSTEALKYRTTSGALHLSFDLRGEQTVSPIEVLEGTEPRTLRLERDPRNYWHPQRYHDGGPGLKMTVEREPVPLPIRGHNVCPI